MLSNFTSYLKDVNSDAKTWLRIFWSAAIGLLTVAMLMVGGVPTLQNATIIMGLPFCFVMFFVMYGLYTSLRVEAFRENSHKGSLAASLSGRIANTDNVNDTLSWRQRLVRAVTYPDLPYMLNELEKVCRPALLEVCAELKKQGTEVVFNDGIEENTGLPLLGLFVAFGDGQNFNYLIQPYQFSTPSFAIRPNAKNSEKYYRLEVHLFEGSQGYNLLGYSKEQIIADIIDQYERHMHFLHLSRKLAIDAP